MLGEGVTHICLEHPDIEEILLICRRASGIVHPKLKETVLPDLMDISSVENQLKGYDACFFCLGISSVGISPNDYYKTTYTLTMNFAGILEKINPGMTFEYISGAGTDATEKGRVRWARVKGKTENDLTKLSGLKTYALRPGFIRPLKEMLHTHAFYKYIGWTFCIGRKLYPAGYCTLEELARAMIFLAKYGYNEPVISGLDIIALGKK